VTRSVSPPVVCGLAADPAEVAEHHRIRRAVFVTEQQVFPESDVDAHAARADVLRVVARVGDGLVGTVRLFPLPPAGRPWQGPLLAAPAGPLTVAAGAMVLLGWGINSAAHTLAMLYFGNIVSGLGAGIVYGTAVGNALKWFPDRRGLAAGLTAAGFGAGSALTVIPIANQIGLDGSGYRSAFLTWGILQGIVVLICGFLLRAPKPGETPTAAGPRMQHAVKDATPTEMLKTPAFWLLYVMFTMAVTGGLMATAQLAPMAADFKVDQIPVSLFGITLVALQFALGLDRILNGITRPFFGWVSDHIGRENTMFIAFTLEGFAILGLINFARDPILFVVLTGLTFFAWGEVYSLFPATSGDLYGKKFATTNYGLLYTAKGTASVFVPIGFMPGIGGQWFKPFALTVVCAVLVSLFVSFSLDPMLSAYWADPHVSEDRKAWITKRLDTFNRWFNKQAHNYRDVIAWALDHRAVHRLGERLRDHIERLLEDGAVLRQRHAEALELVLLVAGAEPDLAAAVGDHVEHRDVLGDLERVAQRQHDHGRRAADGARLRGTGRRQHHPRRDARRSLLAQAEHGDLLRPRPALGRARRRHEAFSGDAATARLSRRAEPGLHAKSAATSSTSSAAC